MRFLIKPLIILATAGLTLANNLPNVTIPPLPDKVPTPDPIQLILELSPQCQGALIGIVSSPEFLTCVPVLSLLPLLTDPTLLPSVIADPIKNAPKLLPIVEAICEDPKCSDEGVAASIQSIQTSCATDLNNPLIQLALAVFTLYSPGRDILCFEDNKGQSCLVDLLTSIFTLPKPPVRILDGGLIDSVALAEPKFLCTPCNKAIVNTLINYFTAVPQAIEILEQGFHIGQEEIKLGELFIAVKCGFQFEDGKVGDSTTDPGKFVYQVAQNGTGYVSTDGDDKKKSGASSIHEIGLIMAGSVLASTLFMI